MIFFFTTFGRSVLQDGGGRDVRDDRRPEFKGALLTIDFHSQGRHNALHLLPPSTEIRTWWWDVMLLFYNLFRGKSVVQKPFPSIRKKMYLFIKFTMCSIQQEQTGWITLNASEVVPNLCEWPGCSFYTTDVKNTLQSFILGWFV